MYFRLPLLLARRVAVPAAAPRPFLTRPFSYTPSAFSPTKAKPVKKPQTATKTTAKSTTTTKAKAKPKPKVKAKTAGRKKVAKAAKKPAFSRAELKVPLRRSPSPYIAYISDQIAQGPRVKSRQEALERTKVLAAQWKALSEDQQQVYKEKAAEMSKKVKAEFDAWITNVDPAILREINKKRKTRGKPKIRTPSTGPKGPVPAFMRFLKDFRVDHPEITGQQVGKEGGEAWRQLPQTKKDVYMLAYHNAKREHDARA